ncbi:MAG: 30S ribosomal protein S1 [Elusimicrobia bacterium]|nr:30S ribosomal protein S1 [Elusimicrobiota bacterium]
MKEASDSQEEQPAQDAEDFAALFEGQASSYAVSGSKNIIMGRVVAKDADYFLVDTGSKSEARLAAAEVPPDLDVAAGSMLPVVHVRSESPSAGFTVSLRAAIRRLQSSALSRLLTQGVKLNAQIYRRRGDGYFAGLFVPQAFEELGEVSGLPRNLERAFPYPAELPISEVDIYQPGQPNRWLGRKIQVKLLELRRDGPVVISRRKVLLEMRETLRRETLANAKEGDVIEARVKEVAAESVGLEINGVAAIMNQSEASWYPKPNLQRRFRIGDMIDVKILKKDIDGQRFLVSRRAVEPNPADELAKNFKKGMVVEGEVSKLLSNGSCFVRLSSLKREAFIPAGELLKELEMKEGAKIKAHVLRVDKENVRVVLSVRRYEEAQMPEIVARYTAGNQPLRLGDILSAAAQETADDDAANEEPGEPS